MPIEGTQETVESVKKGGLFSPFEPALTVLTEWINQRLEQWRIRRAFPKMVRWYSPMQLLRTSSEVFISSILGRHTDRRSIEASNKPPRYFDFSFEPAPASSSTTKSGAEDYKIDRIPKSVPLSGDKSTLWIDYVSDLGDGWKSTSTVAYYLTKDSIDVTLPQEENKTVTLPRGNILIFGGDEVYPTAVRKEYQNRLVMPYQMVAPNNAENRPYLFALPGNHDWYDSLSAFIEFFCNAWDSYFADGRWWTPQNRSYFALKLPKGWWVLAVDVQLQSDLDFLQAKYFRKIVELMQPGDRVILCCAEPYWMYNHMFKASRIKYENSNLKSLVDLIDPRNVMNRKPGAEQSQEHASENNNHIALFLAGDLHHYMSVWNHENHDLSITAGGGGAFLHPTHGSVATAFQGSSYQTYSYPSKKRSWLLGLKNFQFLALNPEFGLITGFVYLIFSWFLVASTKDISSLIPESKEGLTSITLEMIGKLIGTAILSPYLSFLMLLILTGFIFFTFTEQNSRWFRWLVGSLHGLSHIIAAILICFLGYAISIQINPQHSTDLLPMLPAVLTGAAVIFALGFLVGGCLMGIYLFISLNIFGQHVTAAFSSLRIEGWKNFLRMKLDLKTGELTIYPIGLRRVARWKDWEMVSQNGDAPTSAVPAIKLKNDATFPVELIEGPITVKPNGKLKNGVVISFADHQPTKK